MWYGQADGGYPILAQANGLVNPAFAETEAVVSQFNQNGILLAVTSLMSGLRRGRV